MRLYERIIALPVKELPLNWKGPEIWSRCQSKMDLLVKNAPFKRDKQILAIYGHLEDVSSAVLSTCWSSSQLASLHPKTPITGSVRELSDLRDSYQEHSEQLRG